jgi:DNA (cytosine-5)-methyltransferase 1
LAKGKKLKVVSLFSGALGLDLGLEKAGFEIAVCVEYDHQACETIRANTKIPVIEKDINDVTVEEILSTAGISRDEVFMVVGGPPCQAFSTAGKRRSLTDFRGNVIIRFLEIVREIKPKFFILENVRGILSTPLTFVPEEYNGHYVRILNHKGSVAYFVTKEFEKMGYAVNFSLFNSANYGVPQIRERVVFFGSLGKKKIPLPAPTHSKDGSITGNKWVTLSEAIGGLDTSSLHYVKLSPRMQKYLHLLSAGQNWTDLPEKLKEEAMGASYHLGGGKTGFYRRLSWSSPSPTLVTSPAMPATLLVHPDEMRPLSVEEYARIQQFPKDWSFSGSLSDIYKQIGNAVPVGLGYMAGKAVMDFYKANYETEVELNSIPYSRYKNCSYAEFIPAFEDTIEEKPKIVQLGLTT